MSNLAIKKTVNFIALPLVLLTSWWVLSAGSEDFFFPPLSEIFRTFPATWFQERLASDVLPSLGRLSVGYICALVVAVTAGIWIGRSTAVREYVEPILEFFRAIPAPAVVPILILFAGLGDPMKILVIVYGCFWPVLLNTVDGVRGIDEVLQDTAKTYGLSKRGILLHLVLPGAAPRIAAGARQALSLGIILMVISEMFAATNGLGFTVLQFQRTFMIPEMWTGILLLGCLGVTLSLLFRFVEQRALRWYFGFRSAERGSA